MADASAPEGEAVLARAVSAYQAALGSRLIAGYALGSLAHGGFSPLVSDVDLGLILDDPLRAKDGMTIRKVARSVRSGGSALHQRLSVFWGTPSTLQGQGPAAGSLHWTGWTCLSTVGCSRDGTRVPAWPAPNTELLVAGAEFALGYLGGARGYPTASGAGPGSAPKTTTRWTRSVPPRGWSPAGPGG